MKKGLSKFDIYAIAIGTVGIGFAVYKIIEKNKESAGAKKDVTGVKGDLNKMISSGQKLSWTEGSYGNFASQIYQACLGYATDEDAIYRVFRQIKKNVDMAKLIEVFGRRTLPCDWTRPLDNCGTFNLIELLTAELDDSEIKEVNKILTQNGVTAYKL